MLKQKRFHLRPPRILFPVLFPRALFAHIVAVMNKKWDLATSPEPSDPSPAVQPTAHVEESKPIVGEATCDASPAIDAVPAESAVEADEIQSEVHGLLKGEGKGCIEETPSAAQLESQQATLRRLFLALR
jgi:hypothetical protein